VRWRVICRRGHYALVLLAALAIWLGWTASARAESGTSTQPQAEETTGATDTSSGSIAPETEPPPDAAPPSSVDSPLPPLDDPAPPSDEAPSSGDPVPPSDEAPSSDDPAPPSDEQPPAEAQSPSDTPPSQPPAAEPPPFDPPPFESPPPATSSSSPSTSLGGPAPGAGFEASSEPLGVLSPPSLVYVASDASAPVTHLPIRLAPQAVQVLKEPASQHDTAASTPPRLLLPVVKDSASGSIAGGGATGGSSGGASAGLAVALVGLFASVAALLGGIVPVGGQPPAGTRLILKAERPG
jgi:hypothetical protein